MASNSKRKPQNVVHQSRIPLALPCAAIVIAALGIFIINALPLWVLDYLVPFIKEAGKFSNFPNYQLRS